MQARAAVQGRHEMVHKAQEDLFQRDVTSQKLPGEKALTWAQTADINRRPEEAQKGRDHDFAFEGVKQGNRLAEIGASSNAQLNQISAQGGEVRKSQDHAAELERQGWTATPGIDGSWWRIGPTGGVQTIEMPLDKIAGRRQSAGTRATNPYSNAQDIMTTDAKIRETLRYRKGTDEQRSLLERLKAELQTIYLTTEEGVNPEIGQIGARINALSASMEPTEAEVAAYKMSLGIPMAGYSEQQNAAPDAAAGGGVKKDKQGRSWVYDPQTDRMILQQ